MAWARTQSFGCEVEGAGGDLAETQPRRNSEDLYVVPGQSRRIDFDARSIDSVSSVASE